MPWGLLGNRKGCLAGGRCSSGLQGTGPCNLSVSVESVDSSVGKARLWEWDEECGREAFGRALVHCSAVRAVGSWALGQLIQPLLGATWHPLGKGLSWASLPLWASA